MSTPPQGIPNNIDFATEVKSDRLVILLRVTLVAALAVLLGALAIGGYQDISLYIWAFAPGVLVVSSLATNYLLKHQRFEHAAVAYTSGTMIAVGMALVDAGDMAVQLLPYTFVVIVFLVAVLLPPRNIMTAALVAAGITLGVPAFVQGNFDFIGAHQFFAIVLMLLSAGLALQLTGELYAVTEWALMNYQRERRTNTDLFESRTELQRSLLRSQALSDKLQETNADLEEARAAAEAAKNFRGQFLANMSHELRTPLNAIIGFSETMLHFPQMYENVPLPPGYERDLKQIYGSGRQLLALINDILDLARVDAGKLEVFMQPVDLDATIDNVMAVAEGLLGGKPVELRRDIPQPIPRVWADETRVRQVLVNLYSNACKFTERGSITLRVSDVEEGVRFSLHDTGDGIPPEALEGIFEEFRQADAARRDPRSGSGLGLAISRQLLDLMGGRIWAESVVGQGSTFHFLLQRYEPDSEANGTQTAQTTVEGSTTPAAPATERG